MVKKTATIIASIILAYGLYIDSFLLQDVPAANIYAAENAAEPIEGDINNDGVINSADYINIIKYLCLDNSSVSVSDADINHDEKVNAEDIILFKKIFLGANIKENSTEPDNMSTPETQNHLTLNTDGLLEIDFDFTEYTYDTIQEYLNIKLDAQKDFPYWGYEFKSVDYVYNDIPICFMFQYDKLIMIIYDAEKSQENSILNSACKHFGSYEKEDDIYAFETNTNYSLLLYDDYLSETDKEVFKQCYVSNNIAVTNQTDNLIELNSDGLLLVNFDFTCFTYDSIQEFLGIKLDEQKDFPYWGYEFTNVDLIYNDIPLCFMFQNDDLIMIILDSDRSQEKSILNSACKNFGLYDEIENEYIFDINGKFKLSLFEGYLSETDKEVFKQCYFSKFIQEDENELLTADCALYYFGDTLDELKNALGEPDNDPEINPIDAPVGGYLSNSYQYGSTIFSYVNHYPWKGTRVSCLSAGKGTKIMNNVYVGMTFNELCKYFTFDFDKPEIMQIEPVSRATASIIVNGFECELYFDFPMGADSDTPSENFVIYSKTLSADDYNAQNDIKNSN